MSSSLAGVIFIGTLVLALALAYRPMGDLLYRVATSPRHLAPERVMYRLMGVDPDADQPWGIYARSVLAFSAVSILFLYGFPAAAGPPMAQPRPPRRETGPGLEHRGQLHHEHELAVVLR